MTANNNNDDEKYNLNLDVFVILFDVRWVDAVWFVWLMMFCARRCGEREE